MFDFLKLAANFDLSQRLLFITVGQIQESNEKKIQDLKLIFLDSTCLRDQKYVKIKIFHRDLLEKLKKVVFML